MATARKPRSKRRHGALTPELLEAFTAHIRAGLWLANAAELIGVHPVTVDVWLAKGRVELEDATEEMDRTGKMPALGRYGAFVVQVQAAKARVQADMLGVVVEISKSRHPPVTQADGSIVPGGLLDPAAAFKAATWYLERADNLRYGRGALRVDLQAPGAGTPDDHDDPVDLMMERLDAIESNIDTRPPVDPPNSSTAHE